MTNELRVNFDLILDQHAKRAAEQIGGQCGHFSRSSAGKAVKAAMLDYLKAREQRTTKAFEERFSFIATEGERGLLKDVFNQLKADFE